jgi:hypothetical protein
MDFQEFLQTLDKDEPPGVSPLLVALWYDHKGNWERAHQIVQDIDESMASWIHAYLHRKEGDLGNAGYWYSRAGRSRPNVDLSAEWEELVKELI